MVEFLRSGGSDFLSSIEDILNPKENDFQLVTVGANLPDNREVWTSGTPLMVSRYEVKQLL